MFSKDVVKKIAQLSSLELTEEEIKNYVREFNSIMEYFEVLKSADLSDKIDEDTLRFPSGGRNDEIIPFPLKIEDFSPHLENGYFKVPRVLDTEN